MSKKAKEKYGPFLSENFSKLNNSILYEFTFNKWFTPSDKNISDLINSILELYRSKTPKEMFFPDPITSKLECVYILFLNNIIKDITELDELSEKYSHLSFLLHPDSFDYSNVDFSDYMWENIAMRNKYMKIFIQHKEEIIPKILDHLEKDEATEAERKILYGYLLSKTEIWKKNI
jgi:hypothetical protein